MNRLINHFQDAAEFMSMGLGMHVLYSIHVMLSLGHSNVSGIIR